MDRDLLEAMSLITRWQYSSRLDDGQRMLLTQAYNKIDQVVTELLTEGK